MFKKLSFYIKKYKWWYIFGSLMVVCKTTVASFTPRYVQKAIDYLGGEFDQEILLQYIYIIVGISLVNALFLFAMRRITIGASRLIENDFRNDFFAKLQSLDMNFYHHHRTGDLMARATNDLSNIRSVFGPAIMYTVNLIFSFIVYLYMMIEISPLLTFWAVVPIPFMAFIVFFFGRMVHKKQAVIQNLYGSISNFAQENLAGIRVVKSFALERDQVEKFTDLNNTYFSRMVNFMIVSSLFHPIIYFIMSFGIAAILYVGGSQLIQGEISIGDLTAFILYLGMLAWPSIAVGWVAGLYQTGAASMKRIEAIMNEANNVKEPSDPQELRFSESIEFKNLNFSYPNSDVRILKDITFSVKKGETIGIVGAVGSGKSTLLALLNRMYQVDDGQIFIDNTDINQFTVKDLNRFISVVPQETFLFSDSIKNNIEFSGFSDDERRKFVIEKAQLSETLSEFTDGEETLLGERGINLSGGQKQRVSIARALMKKSEILILDDCLSAVDAETERLILNAFRQEQNQRTIFIISHRVSSFQHADQVLFLEHGEIIEHGDHKSLLSQNGRYAQLYEKQQLEEAISNY